MLWSNFLALLVVGHVLLAVTLYTAQLRLPKWLAPACGTFALSLFVVLALSAQNVEKITNDGTIATTSEPVVGIYALGLAAVSFLLTAVLVLDWLPLSSFTGGSSSGY